MSEAQLVITEANQIIYSNLERLAPKISGFVIGELLHKRKVLSESDWDSIKEAPNDYALNERLLLTIAGLGSDALYHLKHALYECEDFYSMEILNSNDNELAENLLYTRTINITGNSSQECAEQDAGDCDFNGSQSIDGALWSKLKKQEPLPDKDVLVKTAGDIVTGEHVYPMTKSPRGICLIINNIHFDHFEHRNSAREDGAFLKSIFKQLDFNVIYHENLPVREMKELLQRTAKNSSLKEHEAFVCIVMSHGLKDDWIAGSDDHYIKLEAILGYFNNSNCPNLINKPKIFFVQACRGDGFDYGVLDPITTADAVPVVEPVKVAEKYDRLPTWGDMCIVHSTMQGYVAFRCRETGSWFANALGTALVEHACDKNLHEILQEVTNSINQRESIKSNKQAIEWTFRGWRKTFYFNPGFSKHQ